MATFQYKALTSGGRLMKGTIEAGTRSEAGELLGQMGLSVNSISRADRLAAARPVGRHEFMLFNRQLASIAKAGIPMERALRQLSHDIASKSMQRLINDIADDLERGQSIEQTFEKRQGAFPALYGRILKAGVETGRLAEMLTSLNRNLETANNTRKIIFEAVSYPLIVFAIGSAIITAVFVFIMPQFDEVLGGMLETTRIPPLTRMFFTMSRNILPFWIGVALAVGAIIAALNLFSTFAAGRRFRESLLLAVPVLGAIHRSCVMGRMADAMSIAITAGCDVPTGLRLASGISGSELMARECDILAGQLQRGQAILEAGHFCRVLPRLFLYSIQLGSQRGELEDNLRELARMYTGQAHLGQGRLQAILLPLMLMLVGTFIAAAVAAIFLPIVQLVSGLS